MAVTCIVVVVAAAAVAAMAMAVLECNGCRNAKCLELCVVRG